MVVASESKSPVFAVSWATDTPHKQSARVPIALVDFDANVDFLPALAAAANAVQAYYDFDVLYLPFPSGVVRPAYYDLARTDVPRFHLGELEGYLDQAPQSLSVKVVCCLTSALLADGEVDDLFSLPLTTNQDVFAISTYGMREYAMQAGTSFAKATLYLCVAGLIHRDPRWSIDYHDETVGCPLDYCNNRDDTVVSLRKMEFSHSQCRDRITDQEMLTAIDALLALNIGDENRSKN